MATAALVFGSINILFAAVDPVLAGMAAFGMLFGTWGLLWGAISIPSAGDESGVLPSRTKWGLILNCSGIILSVIIGLV